MWGCLACWCFRLLVCLIICFDLLFCLGGLLLVYLLIGLSCLCCYYSLILIYNSIGSGFCRHSLFTVVYIYGWFWYCGCFGVCRLVNCLIVVFVAWLGGVAFATCVGLMFRLLCLILEIYVAVVVWAIVDFGIV